MYKPTRRGSRGKILPKKGSKAFHLLDQTKKFLWRGIHTRDANTVNKKILADREKKREFYSEKPQTYVSRRDCLSLSLFFFSIRCVPSNSKEMARQHSGMVLLYNKQLFHFFTD